MQLLGVSSLRHAVGVLPALGGIDQRAARRAQALARARRLREAGDVDVASSRASAAASPERDVEALVRTTIGHAADASSAASFTKGATVIGIHATVFDFASGKITSGEHAGTPIDFARLHLGPPRRFAASRPSATMPPCAGCCSPP